MIDMLDMFHRTPKIHFAAYKGIHKNPTYSIDKESFFSDEQIIFYLISSIVKERNVR